MIIWAVVPVKSLQQGKSRLSELLADEERADLTRQMLSHTLEVLSGIPEAAATLVVSADAKVLRMAVASGARVLREPSPPNLNRAVSLASEAARAAGASAVLVLPADLPLLSAGEIRAMIGLAHEPPVMLIAPDRHRRGTNALLVSPVALIESDFGRDSFARHVRRARAAGARVEICELPGLALDLDSPADFEIYRRGEPLVDLRE